MGGFYVRLAIITASATLIAYIIGEGMVDAEKINAENEAKDSDKTEIDGE